MPATFDVWIPSLRTASSGLSTVSGDVETAGTSASGAAARAGASCGGPLLAAALARWSGEMDRRSQEAATSAAQAGTTMTSNADRYEEDDRAASASLGAAVPDDATGPW